MSGVIEAMAAAMSANHAEGTDEELASDAIEALRAAEEAGWRLVPVDPTDEIIAAIEDHVDGFTSDEVWFQAVGHAPRPWDNKEQSGE